jgi:hypothetical protein
MRVMTDESPMVQAQAPFDGTIAVAYGDFMFLDTDDVKPFSSMPDLLTLILNQSKGSRLFMGIAADARGVLDTAAVNPFSVITDAKVEYPCSSGTFEIGDFVAPVENAGGTALENQKVVKTTDPSLAIGQVTKRYASATTTVEFRLKARVLTHVPNGDVITDNFPLTLHASKVIHNMLVAQEATQIISIDVTPDIPQGGALTGTVVKAIGTATPASATTPMHTANAINLNGAAHTNQPITLTATGADLILAPGDRMALVLNAALTVGSAIITVRRRRL